MSLAFLENLRVALAPPHYLTPPFSGIDISTSGVKAVRLAERPHGLVLASHAEELLEPGAFIDGEYAEPAVIAAALAEASSRASIASANAALPESKSYLFETTAAGVIRDEWRTLVEQHLDELVPLPPAETSFDVMPVGYGAAGSRSLVGIGFARRMVDGALAAFDSAGLEVGALESEMFAMARALLPVGDSSTTLIIDVGKTTTKIAISVSRIPRFTTTILIGGHAFTLAIQKHFGVTEQEARQVKIERGMVLAPGNEDYLAAMLSTAAAIKDEISHRLEYWQGHGAESGGHEPVSRAILVGGNASVRGFREYLESALGIPVATGDVFTNLAPQDYWISDLDHAESLAYATAIGLALRDQPPSPTPDSLDLLPAERVRARWWRYVLRLGTVAAYLALTLVVIASILLIPTFVFLRNTEITKQARLASIESVLSSADEAALAARLSALSNDATILVSLASAPSATTLIRQALAVGRSGIRLSSIAYTPGKGSRSGTLTLSGISATRNGLRAYQLALAESTGFANADLPVSSYAKDNDIPFTITVTLAKPTSP